MRILLFLIVLFYIFRNDAFPINTEKTKRDLQNASALSIVRRDCDYSKHFVGSNLFDGHRKICFSTDDVNLLIARRDFEMMIPRDLPQDLLDDKSVANIMRYFYYGLWLLRRVDDCNMRRTMEKAFYDTLGGFLGYYLVPVCKYSYYASRVELKTVRNVMALYQKCRSFLNTNGNGWRPPMRDPATELTCVRIEPLSINPAGAAGENCDDEQKFCNDLDLGTANNGMEIVDDNMIVSLPKIELEDDNGYLSNIWLPFSRKRTYNLRSCKSAFIFVKFFRTVSNCYKEKCMAQKSFDQKFRQWIIENIRVHLSDELFYPGLGGILNVYESLRKYNRDADVIEPTEGNENSEAKISERRNAQMSLVEANSCALAEDFELTNSKLKKRQINNEDEVDFLERSLENNTPLDAEDESVDEWIRKFDESMLEDFQRKKIKKIKCKPKCKARKKKPLPTESETTKPSSGSTILTTTDKSIMKFTTTTKMNQTTPSKTTTPKPMTTTKPKTTSAPKTEKQPMSEKSKRELLKCIFIAIAFSLFILLLLALIIFFRKYGKDGWERFKGKLRKLNEKIKSMKTSKANAKPAASVKSIPSKAAPSPADKKSKAKKGKESAKPATADSKATKGKTANKKPDKKAEKAAAKTEAKPDPKAAKKVDPKADKKVEKTASKTDTKAVKKDAKADKKLEKSVKKAEKSIKKVEKDAKKAQKEAEKAAKKAAKEAKKAEKAAKKREGSKSGKSESDASVSPRRRGGNHKSPPKPILGFVSKPTKVRRHRGGRLSRSRSRSRSRSSGSSRI